MWKVDFLLLMQKNDVVKKMTALDKIWVNLTNWTKNSATMKKNKLLLIQARLVEATILIGKLCLKTFCGTSLLDPRPVALETHSLLLRHNYCPWIFSTSCNVTHHHLWWAPDYFVRKGTLRGCKRMNEVLNSYQYKKLGHLLLSKSNFTQISVSEPIYTSTRISQAVSDESNAQTLVFQWELVCCTWRDCWVNTPLLTFYTHPMCVWPGLTKQLLWTVIYNSITIHYWSSDSRPTRFRVT